MCNNLGQTIVVSQILVSVNWFIKLWQQRSNLHKEQKNNDTNRISTSNKSIKNSISSIGLAEKPGKCHIAMEIIDDN